MRWRGDEFTDVFTGVDERPRAHAVPDGWQGRRALDVPVVVVTHRVTTDWVEAHRGGFLLRDRRVEAAIARAQELAGDRVVAITGAPSPASAWTWGCSTRWPSTWSPS